MRHVAEKLDVLARPRIGGALFRRVHRRIFALADGPQPDLRIALAHSADGVDQKVKTLVAHKISHEQDVRKTILRRTFSRREFLDVDPTMNDMDLLDWIVVMLRTEARGVVARRENSVRVMDHAFLHEAASPMGR